MAKKLGGSAPKGMKKQIKRGKGYFKRRAASPEIEIRNRLRRQRTHWTGVIKKAMKLIALGEDKHLLLQSAKIALKALRA